MQETTRSWFVMRLLLFRLSYFVLLTSSCTTQPYQEMSDARQAIKAAQQAKVWQYSTDLTPCGPNHFQTLCIQVARIL